ncbi:LemA family protein [Hyphococcus sp.]|uniref:LemA family protein n=1 Tax=Hyphococcus sp. TaxID=2038636 RepID=UPI00207F65B3|nr:MAG: membrane protein [Marinicaulis sp.]
MSGILIFLGVIVVLAVFIIGIYNRIVALSQRTEQAFADVDVQLKQRHDLIPNLVETVKGYASHEKETLDAVITARNAAQSASGPAAQGAAEGVLGAALGKLFALAEAYPDLKANTNFLELQRELSDVENKIAAARRFFNNSVQEYNTAIQQIPGNFVAPLGSFGPKEYFEVPEASRTQIEAAPEVKF